MLQSGYSVNSYFLYTIYANFRFAGIKMVNIKKWECLLKNTFDLNRLQTYITFSENLK